MGEVRGAVCACVYFCACLCFCVNMRVCLYFCMCICSGWWRGGGGMTAGAIQVVRTRREAEEGACTRFRGAGNALRVQRTRLELLRRQRWPSYEQEDCGACIASRFATQPRHAVRVPRLRATRQRKDRARAAALFCRWRESRLTTWRATTLTLGLMLVTCGRTMSTVRGLGPPTQLAAAAVSWRRLAPEVDASRALVGRRWLGRFVDRST